MEVWVIKETGAKTWFILLPCFFGSVSPWG